MSYKEKERNIQKQLRLAKVFKAVISAGIIAPVFVSATACEKEAPAVEESETALPVEKEEQPQYVTQESEADKEEEASFEKPPVEEKQKEEIPPKTEEAQIEFTQDMIKNRLTFPEHIKDTEEWFKIGGLVPLWLVEDWGPEPGYEYLASGVVAGPLKKEVGLSGEEELLLPIAFQNPETSEFYIRNISFGTDEVINANNNLGGISITFLKNYEYLHGKEGNESYIRKVEDVLSNIKQGEQICFVLNYDYNDVLPEKEMEENPSLKTSVEFIVMYWENNKAFYEAMRNNDPLPDLEINSGHVFINELVKEE